MPANYGDVAVEHAIVVAADPARTIAAFFDAAALPVWWQTVRSVTTPRPLGIYAVEWETTPFRDELLGPLGGTMYGTVLEYRAAREFFLAEVHWLPPAGDPIGPMAIEVSCRAQPDGTRLRVRQSGYENSDRWHRYYEIIASGWRSSLQSLKTYLEAPEEAAPTAPT